MSGINDVVFNKGKEILNKIVASRLNDISNLIAERVSERVRHDGEYFNVTGNTRGSIAFGVFYNGKLQKVETPYAKEFTERKTLIKGESYKRFKAPTGDKRYHGFEESEKFIRSFIPSVRKGFDIVFVVGTEYAEYVENVRRKNVMTDTFQFCQVTRDGLITGSMFPSTINF